jgi:RNA polymerase sigma-70 factor (ECF subfamily)
MNNTSQSLLGRLRGAGDTESWKRLVDLYQPLLRGWLRGYQAPDQDSDDLVQEVLTVLVKDLRKFDHPGHPGAFRGWLRGILVNRLRAFWRAGRGRPVVPGGSDFFRISEQLEDPISELRRQWDEEYERCVLSRLLGMLEDEFAPKTLLAFRRVGLEGAKARDVAQELGMTVGAVYVAKSAVLRRLRQEAQGLIN